MKESKCWFVSLPQFVPERFYNKSLFALGMFALYNVYINVTRFIGNKKRISERKETLLLNIAKLKDDLKKPAVGGPAFVTLFCLYAHLYLALELKITCHHADRFYLMCFSPSR